MHAVPHALRSRHAAALAAGVILVFGPAMPADAKPPPSPGLRVVWERDLSIESHEGEVPGAPASAGHHRESGLWPRVDRVEVRSSAGPHAHEGANELDVRGRLLPAVRRR